MDRARGEESQAKRRGRGKSMKYIATLLASVMLIPPSAAVIDIFARHEVQREALRSCEAVIEAVEEIPTVTEYATPAIGVGREAVYNATQDELEQLVILAYLEAGGESDECVRAVAEVIFNRLSYGSWGETLSDVIHAPGEFEPAAYIAEFAPCGNLIIEDRLDEIRDIVYDVFYNGSTLPARVMFFRSGYYHQWNGAVDEFVIGDVYFSSSRWCEEAQG